MVPLHGCISKHEIQHMKIMESNYAWRHPNVKSQRRKEAFRHPNNSYCMPEPDVHVPPSVQVPRLPFTPLLAIAPRST